MSLTLTNPFVLFCLFCANTTTKIKSILYIYNLSITINCELQNFIFTHIKILHFSFKHARQYKFILNVEENVFNTESDKIYLFIYILNPLKLSNVTLTR